jgi:hypothetical protein
MTNTDTLGHFFEAFNVWCARAERYDYLGLDPQRHLLSVVPASRRAQLAAYIDDPDGAAQALADAEAAAGAPLPAGFPLRHWRWYLQGPNDPVPYAGSVYQDTERHRSSFLGGFDYTVSAALPASLQDSSLYGDDLDDLGRHKESKTTWFSRDGNQRFRVFGSYDWCGQGSVEDRTVYPLLFVLDPFVAANADLVARFLQETEHGRWYMRWACAETGRASEGTRYVTASLQQALLRLGEAQSFSCDAHMERECARPGYDAGAECDCLRGPRGNEYVPDAVEVIYEKLTAEREQQMQAPGGAELPPLPRACLMPGCGLGRAYKRAADRPVEDGTCPQICGALQRERQGERARIEYGASRQLEVTCSETAFQFGTVESKEAFAQEPETRVDAFGRAEGTVRPGQDLDFATVRDEVTKLFAEASAGTKRDWLANQQVRSDSVQTAVSAFRTVCGEGGATGGTAGCKGCLLHFMKDGEARLQELEAAWAEVLDWKQGVGTADGEEGSGEQGEEGEAPEPPDEETLRMAEEFVLLRGDFRRDSQGRPLRYVIGEADQEAQREPDGSYSRETERASVLRKEEGLCSHVCVCVSSAELSNTLFVDADQALPEPNVQVLTEYTLDSVRRLVQERLGVDVPFDDSGGQIDLPNLQAYISSTLEVNREVNASQRAYAYQVVTATNANVQATSLTMEVSANMKILVEEEAYLRAVHTYSLEVAKEWVRVNSASEAARELEQRGKDADSETRTELAGALQAGNVGAGPLELMQTTYALHMPLLVLALGLLLLA